jgi:C-terminal processing protease CtpA/Prc
MCIAMLVAAAWSGCVLPTRIATGEAGKTQGPAALARRFDRVDRLIRTRYYARDLHGVAWAELSARYRPLAASAENNAAWYDTVNEMLSELRDAHTRARRPEPHQHKTVREDGADPAENSGRAACVRPDGIVYLRFGRFDAANLHWLIRQIETHQDAPGMIIDLRNNPGGLVTSAQRAVGLFFRQGVPMGRVIARDGRRTIERSRPTPHRLYPGPLAVLIGPGSRSSAEVFAYVMQYHARAVLIGQPTAGQVLGARPYRLPDGGQLYVSISDFQCFDSGRLEGAGVRPDIAVQDAGVIAGEFSERPEDDPALTAALAALRVAPDPR